MGNDSLTMTTNLNSTKSTESSGSNNSRQKRGAERLFQYLEADDSDPEDYSR